MAPAALAPAPGDEAAALAEQQGDEEGAQYHREWQAARDKHLAALNPCEICGSNQDEGPEGDSWYQGHCWKCGYVPGLAVSPGVMMTRPGMSAAEADAKLLEMRRAIVDDLLAALRTGEVPDVTLQPHGGGPAQPLVDAEALRAIIREEVAGAQPTGGAQAAGIPPAQGDGG